MPSFDYHTYLIGPIASCIAVYFGAITLNTPRQFLIACGIGGFICWLFYVLSLPYYGNTTACFISSLSVAFYSHLMARKYKAPVTIFFIPGFLPTVPGAGIYQTVFYYLSGNTEKFNTYLSESIKTAVVIAIAIVIVDALFRSGKRIKKLFTH